MTDQPSLLTLVDRLSKLEGLLIGLQNSIIQGQQQTSAFMSRVERLEARQVELERNMITKDDIASLVNKVDSLATSDAKQQGGTAVAKWSANTLGTWAAVLLSLLALIGVGTNRERIQSSQQAPATPHGLPAGR
jgi:hypothetical protein